MRRICRRLPPVCRQRTTRLAWSPAAISSGVGRPCRLASFSCFARLGRALVGAARGIGRRVESVNFHFGQGLSEGVAHLGRNTLGQVQPLQIFELPEPLEVIGSEPFRLEQVEHHGS